MENTNKSRPTRNFKPSHNKSRIDSKNRHLVKANYLDIEQKQNMEVVVEDQKEKILQITKRSPKINKGQQVEGKTNNVENILQKPPCGKRNKRKTSKRSSLSYLLKEKNSKIATSSGGDVEKGSDNPDLGPYLLKKARDIISSGDNQERAFEFALRAKKSFESCGYEKPNLDYVMCLHFLASMHCNTCQYKEAISLLKHSIEIPKMELGQNHALAKFVGCMRLGDIYAMMGHIEESFDRYKVALDIQKQVLGDKDTRFGETCRYVAEAYVQAFEFDEAEKLCRRALDIRKVNGCPPSIEEAADRRLMGLICDSKENYEAALENYVLARMAMHCNGQESDAAVIDCNIGDAYLALARYDEAIFSYKKALSTFTSSKGKNHPAVASVFVHLGELYNKIGKFSESKSYCESAFEIYNKKPNDTDVEDVANGFTDLATIYESMNELDQALNLLHKALELQKDQGVQRSKIAGIEAQIGVIYFRLGNYTDSYNFLKSSVLKFEASGGKKSSLYAVILNQLGLICVHLCKISEASQLFEEAKSILDREYGTIHPDTLGVCSNLASTYDALGRLVILPHLYYITHTNFFFSV